MPLAANRPRYLFNLITLIAIFLVIDYGFNLAQALWQRLITPFKMESDFGLFYCGAAQFFGHGLSPYWACAGHDTLSGFLYPPLSLLYFYFFPILGGRDAFVVHGIVSASLLAGSLVLMLRHLMPENRRPWQTFDLWCCLLAPAPVFMTLQGGQANMLVLASFVFALHMAQKRHFWIAASIIAAGFWFKVYPLALIALFGASEKNRGIIWRTLIVAVVLALVALPVIPWTLHHDYFGRFLPNLQRFTLPGIAHSLSAQLLYFREPAPVALPPFRSVPIPGGLSLLSKGILLPGLLLSMLHTRLEDPRAPFEALALLLVLVLMASPLAWGHHFLLVLPALAAVLSRLADNKAGRAESLVAVLCWLQFTLPSWTSLPFAVGDGWSGRIIAHLFYARYPLAALGLGGLIVAARAREYGPALKILAEKVKPGR